MDTSSLAAGCAEGQVERAGECIALDAIDGGTREDGGWPADCEMLSGSEERTVATHASAPSVAAFGDAFGVIYVRGGEVWFRPLDVQGRVIEGEAGKERLVMRTRGEGIEARASITGGDVSFGLTVARDDRGIFRELGRDGSVRGDEIATTPETAFTVGHTRVLRDEPSGWHVFHTGIAERLVWLHVDDAGHVDDGETLVQGHVYPPSVSYHDGNFDLAWAATLGGETTLSVRRRRASEGHWGPAREIDRAPEPEDVGSPVVATSLSGYGVAWIHTHRDLAQGVATFRDFDGEGKQRCEVRLDGSPAGGLFTPRDMIDRVDGYYLLGSADTGGGALRLLDIQVDGDARCYIRAEHEVSSVGAQVNRAIARNVKRYMVVVWRATDADEIRVRTFSPVPCGGAQR